MLNDPLANALSKLNNAEQRSKKVCIVKPMSKIIKNVLTLMNEQGFIGEFPITEDKKGNFATVQLIGKVNKCGAIKPRHAVKKTDIEKHEKRYLPAKDFGILIISTPNGITTHTETKKKLIGGRLLAYCY